MAPPIMLSSKTAGADRHSGSNQHSSRLSSVHPDAVRPSPTSKCFTEPATSSSWINIYQAWISMAQYSYDPRRHREVRHRGGNVKLSHWYCRFEQSDTRPTYHLTPTHRHIGSFRYSKTEKTSQPFHRKTAVENRRAVTKDRLSLLEGHLILTTPETYI